MTKFLLVAALAAASQSQAFELATIMGQPDESLEFVKNLVQLKIDVISESPEMDWTTAQYSILAREGVLSTISIGVTGESGSSSYGDLLRGYQEAEKYSGIALVYVGPITDDVTCRAMSEASDRMVFVVPAGSESSGIPNLPESCLSPNIIRVTALNRRLDDLATFSNFGATSIQVAAPGENINVTLAGGKQQIRQGTTLSASLVAARLVAFSRLHHETGIALAQSFLNGATYELPALKGKVQSSRAIK